MAVIVGVDVGEDWCPILDLLGATVLGSGEDEREWVLAIANGLPSGTVVIKERD